MNNVNDKLSLKCILYLERNYPEAYPRRVINTLKNLNNLVPGYEATVIEFMDESIDKLCNGGFVALAGSIGCGKTTAACYGMAVVGTLTGIRKPELVTSYQIMSNAFVDRASIYGYSNLLIIDDVGKEYFTDAGWGLNVWDGLFDYRYSHELSTIITTNLLIDEFRAKYKGRIYDRFRETGTWYNIRHGSLRRQHYSKEQ